MAFNKGGGLHLPQTLGFGSVYSLTASNVSISKRQDGKAVSFMSIDHLDQPYELPQGKVTIPLAVTAFAAVLGGSFPHGYNTGVLNAPQHLIKDFLNASYTDRIGSPATSSMLNFLWSLTVAIYLLGGMFGAFIAGWAADKFGRKKAILYLYVPIFLASILFGFCKMAQSFEMMIIARFIIGFGCGAGSGLVPMYMTEIAPINIRGAMGVLHQLALTSGILVSQVVGLREILGNEDGWPILLSIPALPCLISLCILPFFPDSPRYLLVKMKDETSAEHALQRFRGKSDVSADIKEMREEQKLHLAEPEWSLNRLFKTQSVRLPLLIVCGLALIQQLSGINVVFYYSTNVFERAGIAKHLTQYATLGMGSINVIMTIISVPLMEKAGRRTLLLGGMIVMSISTILITVTLNLQSSIQEFSYMSIVCTVLFVVGFAIGLGSIPQFIGAELFRQGPRPAAMSFGGMLNWLANFLVAILFPTMEEGMKAFSFSPFLVLLILFTIFFWIKLPETRNKSFAEIAALFHIKNEDEESFDSEEKKPFDQSKSGAHVGGKHYEQVPTDETSFTNGKHPTHHQSKKQPSINSDVKVLKERTSLINSEEEEINQL